MKGNNVLELNKATMLAALNCYFVTIYKVAPIAKDISEKSGSYTGTVFLVSVSEAESD